MTATPLLAVSGLKRAHGPQFCLGPVDLTGAAGETVAILGRNGAGKTTLFQLLTGHGEAHSGEVRLAGQKLRHDTPAIKARVGYLPQDPLLPRWASGREVLNYALRLRGLSDGPARLTQAEQYWDLSAFANRALANLSYGMHKRLGLALATLADPDLLVLDEPFSGLDLVHVRALVAAIEQRQKAGKLTILSTHVLAFAATLCQRAIILEAGCPREIEGYRAMSRAAREQAIETSFFGQEAAR